MTIPEIAEIPILLRREFLTRFDEFLDELQSNNLIAPGSRQEGRSDIVLAAVESFMNEWKGIKGEKVEETKIEKQNGNVYLRMAHEALRGIRR